MSQVIAFPPRPAPAVTHDQARLQQSLAKLAQPLDEQKAAVAVWRGALGDLKHSMAQLGDNLANYRQNLAQLASGIDHLGHQTRKLVQITETV